MELRIFISAQRRFCHLFLRLFAEGFLVTEIAKKLNRSIKTISSQKKSAMMKLGVENDIALLNYLSSVTLSPADKD